MEAQRRESPTPHWSLADLPWDRLDPARADPELLKVVKAAALVEANGGTYADYLCGVFHDDPEFQAVSRGWAAEEVQHGQALARWAAAVDPTFDFAAAFGRFAEAIRLPVGATRSVRGSRSGELVARCMVEVGTSSFYTALYDAAEEPVLKEICRRIAADELRHYKLFYTHLKRYQEKERVGLWQRLWAAASRVGEIRDDELAFAYYAGNGARGDYDRRRASRAYARRAYANYRPHHVERGVAMAFKAIGLKPHGRLAQAATRLAYGLVDLRARRLAAAGA